MSHFMSEHLLDLTFSGLHIGVGIYDKEGRVISCNEEFRKLKSSFLIDDGQLHKVIKIGKADRMLLTGNKDKVLESFVAPCKDEKGEISSYVYRLSDVTQL